MSRHWTVFKKTSLSCPTVGSELTGTSILLISHPDLWTSQIVPPCQYLCYRTLESITCQNLLLHRLVTKNSYCKACFVNTRRNAEYLVYVDYLCSVCVPFCLKVLQNMLHSVLIHKKCVVKGRENMHFGF